jgi:hypothetical protein
VDRCASAITTDAASVERSPAPKMSRRRSAKVSTALVAASSRLSASAWVSEVIFMTG